MKEYPQDNVLDVLLYMFENHMFGDDAPPDQDVLTAELSQAGFADGMIHRAFAWLENLAHLRAADNSPAAAAATALRHYTPEESARLGVAAQGLLLHLEQCGALEPTTRELVIKQLLELEVENIDMDRLKWVILMVLSNYSADGCIPELTESLILDGLHTCIH